MSLKRKIVVMVILVMIISFLMLGCGGDESAVATNKEVSTTDSKVITLKATDELLTLLETWDGKYTIFVNKNTEIETLEDLNGKPIYCDIYTYGIDVAVDDMGQFTLAADVEMDIGFGNNMPQFLNLMAEREGMVGFLPTMDADENDLKNNPDLKIIVFE